MKERIIEIISAIVLVIVIGFVWRSWYVDYHGFIDEVSACSDDYYKESRRVGIATDLTNREVWDLCVNLVRESENG